MKRFFIGLGLLLFLATSSYGQLKKQRLFKVDPASGLFKEIRVAAEYRIKGAIWAYAAPFGFHQTWIPRSNDRFDRPDSTLKTSSIGMRLGVKYFFSEDSPKGLFIQPMAAYKLNRTVLFDDGLNTVSRDFYNSVGVGFTVGWQNLFGPKDNFAYGIMGGMEYYRHFGQGYHPDRYVENWYNFPFPWKPEFLNGFRLYIGVELGFAFLQKHLHW